MDSGGICPFCEQELNMSSDQRNTIIGKLINTTMSRLSESLSVVQLKCDNGFDLIEVTLYNTKGYIIVRLHNTVLKGFVNCSTFKDALLSHSL